MEKPKDIRRLVVIGDIHGRDIWARIVSREPSSTKEIFIGDYFDSWHESFEQQMANFKNILAYKRQNPERVVLLIGNHDYQYISDTERYSGYQALHASEIGEVVWEALKQGDMQVAYEDSGFFFTHAGVTNAWLENQGFDFADNLVVTLNRWMLEKPSRFVYDKHDPSGTGEAVFQWPLWVRPDGLKLRGVEGYRQVVGHTKVRSIVPMKGLPIFIDVFDYENQYLVIDDGKPRVEIIKS